MGQVKFVIFLLALVHLVGCGKSDDVSPDQIDKGIYYKGPMEKPRKQAEGVSYTPKPKGPPSPASA